MENPFPLPFPCLSVCSFLFPTLSSSRFCLSPRTKRIKWERRAHPPVLGSFWSSIDQGRETHNAILLFVVAINVVAPPVSFNSFFLSLLVEASLWWSCERDWQVDVFLAGAIESRDGVWLLIFSFSGRPSTISRFLIGSVHPIDSRNYVKTYTYQLGS